MTTDDNHHEASSLLDIIRHVIETFQDTERSDEDETAGHGTVSERSFRTDYEFTVSTGLNHDRYWGRPSIKELSDGTTATINDTNEDRLVDVREERDAIIVLADLPQATAESITTEIDRERNEFVIGLGGKIIGEIPLNDADITVTDSTFNNGVLEVRLQTGESTTEEAADE